MICRKNDPMHEFYLTKLGHKHTYSFAAHNTLYH